MICMVQFVDKMIYFANYTAQVELPFLPTVFLFLYQKDDTYTQQENNLSQKFDRYYTFLYDKKVYSEYLYVDKINKMNLNFPYIYLKTF